MAFFNSRISMSWILSVTLLSVVIQTSFSLSQDATNVIPADNAKIVDNITTAYHDEKTNQNVNPITDDVQNDTRNCFPYFISQDIESLLNQALRALSKAKNDRQRSWLQLFVRRLESLSSQLRKLPVKYLNRCFYVRERIKPDDLVINTDLSSAPEEVQLKLAKKLFLSNHHRNDRIKEYITGKVSTRRHEEDQQKRPEEENNLDTAQSITNQSNKAHIAQLSNKNIIRDGIQNSKLQNNVELDSNLASSYLYPKRNNYNPLHYGLPILYWKRQHMDIEMPFLPRVTRKIPHPIDKKMKFRALLSPLQNHISESTINSEVEDQTVLPIQSNDHVSVLDAKESIATDIPTSEDHNEEPHHRSSTQQYQKPTAQFEVHAFNTLQSTGLDTVTSEGITQDVDDKDDLVIQLHSGGQSSMAPKDTIDPRIVLKNKPISVRVLPPSVSSEKAEELATTEKVMENEEDKEVPNFEETPVNSKMEFHRDHDVHHVTNENNINTSDFDYEEEGAATGELFIDDDVVPTKYLTAPSLGGSTEGYSNTFDDAVKQLDELKSVPIHNDPSSVPMQEIETLHEATNEGIQNLPVDNK